MITTDINGRSFPSGFSAHLLDDNRDWSARLFVDGSEVDCAIVRMEVTKGCCGSEEAFSIGNVVSSTLTAELKELSTPLYGKEVDAQIGIYFNDERIWIRLGYFTIAEVKRTAYKAEITGYGRTISATGINFVGGDVVDHRVTPITVERALEKIQTQIREYTGDNAFRIIIRKGSGTVFPSDTFGFSANKTIYQTLRIIASLVGGFVIDDENNNIVVCTSQKFKQTDTAWTRTTATMLGLPEREETDFVVTGVVCTVQKDRTDEEGGALPDYTLPVTPTGNENLFVENPFMVLNYYNTFLSTLTGYEYRPAAINLTYGDPRLEGVDAVQVVDVDGEEYLVPCHMVTHTYTGGLTTKVVAVKPTEQANDTSSSAGSLTETLASMQNSTVQTKLLATQAERAAQDAQDSADNAAQAASDAQDSADNAQASADNAQASADAAQASADTAQASADDAIEDAARAYTAANNASEYASRALGNLSTVQSVTETLTWITQHGTMTLTSDTELDPTHVYFVIDQNGDYVVGSTHYAIVTEPNATDLGTYYELSIDESLNNYVATHLALTNEGLSVIKDNSGYRMLLANDGMYIKAPNGNTVNQATANGNVFKAQDGTVLANIGYGETQGSSGVTNAPFYTFGTRKEATTEYSATSTYNVGDLCLHDGSEYVCWKAVETPTAWDNVHWSQNWKILKGNLSLAQGTLNIASGSYSTAEGQQCMTLGIASHAEGTQTTALSNNAHSEGNGTVAKGSESHAEGYGTQANGAYSHAEGENTIASKEAAHAEGRGTNALGKFSHAGNYYTTAGYDYQTAIGAWNDNKSTNIFEIGKGTQSSPKNIFEVDQYGNVNIPLNTYYKRNGTALSASDVGAVPTTRKVNNKALSSDITLSASDVGALPMPSAGSVSEMGQYIDLHASGGASDYDTRLSTNAATATGGGFLHVNGKPIKDFVTESGTSSSWYYRKWVSGKVEAWRTYNAGAQTPAQWVTGWYYKDLDVAIPSGIFSSAPNHTVATNNGSDYQYMIHTARATSATNIRVRCVKPNSGAATPVIALYVSNMV